MMRAKLWQAMIVATLVVASSVLPSPALAAKRGSPKIDEMPLARWAKLRETERYQLNVSEKIYRENNFLGAAAEYEKFLSLYESSEGASFAQLKWSMCQVQLKKLNTAIKDGYQTVIDYWPDSPEAIAAAYLIGKTYKDMGDIPLAKKAYQNVLTKHGEETVGMLAKIDLAEIARIEQDPSKQIAMLKDVVFKTERDADTKRYCVEASRTLAMLSFAQGAFVDGKDSFATTYQEPELSYWIWHDVRGAITQLVGVPETKEKGLKLADAAIAYFQPLIPAAPKDDAEKTRLRQVAYYVADAHAAAARAAEAGKVFDDLLQKLGNDDDVLSRYATWLKTQTRRADARNMFARMKNQIEGQYQLAYMLREENKHLEAVPIYQDLLAKDAEHAQRWQWQIAEAYREAGKHTEAIASYQLCDNFPTNLERIAGCYRQMKQWPQAIATYTQILGGYESSAPSALLQIGYTQEAAGQSESAIKTFQQVCKRFPKAGEASQAHTHLNNKYNILITLGGAKSE
jgi:tetratricopeptide (TPR) repeat protein